MLYEIINMSDPYTIEADDLEVACTACVLLGRGEYAFKHNSEAVSVPMFIFGNADSWCQGHFQKSLQATVDGVMKDKAAELATCFESCLIGKAQDRETYRAGLALIDDEAKREQWRKKWHEESRSSMNNIGARAYEMARKLREGSKNPIVIAPQQVFTS